MENIWVVSNYIYNYLPDPLQTQRLVYLCHLAHLKEFTTPLVAGHFVASIYGPVHYLVDRALQKAGTNSLALYMMKWERHSINNERTTNLVNKTIMKFSQYSGGQLISLYGVSGSAWEKNYQKGNTSTTIPLSDLLADANRVFGPVVQ